MRHEQPSSENTEFTSDKVAAALPLSGFTPGHIQSISDAVKEANSILQIIVSERTQLVRAMNRAVNAHLDLERSSERLRKATHAEQDLVSKRTTIEYKITEFKREINRVFPEIYNQINNLTERVRDHSLAISGHPNGIHPRAHQGCTLSASEKSLMVLKQQAEKLSRINRDLRSELNRQLEDFLQEEAPSRNGLLAPTLIHFANSPFESDAVHLTINADIIESLQREIEEVEDKYENINLLYESHAALEFDLDDAQDSILRERAQKAGAFPWVIKCDEQFQTARKTVHTYLARAGNYLIDTLVQVNVEVNRGKSSNESSLGETCRALGSLLYDSNSLQSFMGISDLENKIDLLSKTIGVLDLEFGLMLNPNAESNAQLRNQKRPSTNQILKVPSKAFELSGINLLHEHGYRNQGSAGVLLPHNRHSPEQVRVVSLNRSHLLIVAELLEQTWQKSLSHKEMFSILENEQGFGFVALDRLGTLLSVGIADIIQTEAFIQTSQDSPSQLSKTCRLINLTAREEYRKLGCGKIVTHAILAEAAARGAARTVCSVEADNFAGLNYLRDKHQFKSIGIMTTPNHDEYYVLARELGDDFKI